MSLFSNLVTQRRWADVTSKVKKKQPNKKTNKFVDVGKRI